MLLLSDVLYIHYTCTVLSLHDISAGRDVSGTFALSPSLILALFLLFMNTSTAAKVVATFLYFSRGFMCLGQPSESSFFLVMLL
jgi:hypothetical protein